ncbi:hypothetical protein F4604DRAFT_1927779 [Suillus subluteus]|nr:hypothetical protein F4604DRAFT_1927779 [Suillus subluteus]
MLDLHLLSAGNSVGDEKHFSRNLAKRSRRKLPGRQIITQALLEPKVGHTQGCALIIQLSPHVIKVYASHTIYNMYNETKAAGAEAALHEGALDFIKHGNDQLCPASPELYSTSSSSDTDNASAKKQPPSTLQALYKPPPRPFHESSQRSIGNTLVVELNDGTVLDEVEVEYPVGRKLRHG